MPFGCIVIGPPGTGKSTFCHGLYQFLSALERKPQIINLDPSNDSLPYPCPLSITSLTTSAHLQSSQNLGPNGAMIEALETLADETQWLMSELNKLGNGYFVFDCPGQVELFTHCDALPKIVKDLRKANYRVSRIITKLVCVNLIDSTITYSMSNFIAASLLSLRSMVFMELPHINVLSKCDLVYHIDAFIEMNESALRRDSPAKWSKLTDALWELINEYGFVSYYKCAVEDKELMRVIVAAIDRANGFIFGGLEKDNSCIFEVAVNEDLATRINYE